jgi:hypothetical protein
MPRAAEVIESLIQEVHWGDVWPEGFKKLMAEWKGKHTHGLYVQFTNVADPLSKSANPEPSHSDPVGNYGYPLDYVLSHPADIWYGHGTRYARVLRSKARKTLRLDRVSWSAASEVVWRLRLPYDLNTVKKVYRDRAKGSTGPGKILMSAIQMDLGAEPTKNGWGIKRYPTRTGMEQTKLFLKAGYDAVEDLARSHKQASINDREPNQIIFLTPTSFDVVSVYRLSDPRDDNHVDTTLSWRMDVLEKKIAVQIATAMGDSVTGDKETSGLMGVTRRWTKKGRQIDIEAVDTSLSDRFNSNTHKPHKLSKKSSPHAIKVTVLSERGKFYDWTEPGDKALKIIDYFKDWWKSNASVSTGATYSKQKAKDDADRTRFRGYFKEEPASEYGKRRCAVFRELFDTHPEWTTAQWSEEVDRRVGHVESSEFVAIENEIKQNHPDWDRHQIEVAAGAEICRRLDARK